MLRTLIATAAVVATAHTAAGQEYLPAATPCDPCAARQTLLERPTLFRWPGQESPEPDAGEKPLVTDRPTFTAASSTVGKGTVLLETGYTYFYDEAGGVTTRQHSFPEALLRVGVLADWLELRISQNFLNVRPAGGPRDTGAEDLLLGVKLALAAQDGPLPELGLLLRATVPTGDGSFGTNELRPGLDVLYGWSLTDSLSLAGNTQFSRGIDGTDDDFLDVGQSAALAYSAADNVTLFGEAFALFPSGANDPAVSPRYFYNGGALWLLADNVQLDIRAGLGLNDRSTDFFAGAGLSVRY